MLTVFQIMRKEFDTITNVLGKQIISVYFLPFYMKLTKRFMVPCGNKHYLLERFTGDKNRISQSLLTVLLY